MSNPIMEEDGRHVRDRNGEFYKITSTYRLPTDPGLVRTPWRKLTVDLDELQNKPRRFFDTLLSLVEAKRLADPNHKEYYDYLIEGCEMWLSAVENGLYTEVIRLSQPLTEEGEKLKEEAKDWL